MIDLVLIYNHKYESNIAKLDRYYAGRFNRVWQLIPFYRGKLEHVIPVYDNSFIFQNFVAQAARTLAKNPADYTLFVSDDLLLDSAVTQETVVRDFNLQPQGGFTPELLDPSEGHFGRGVIEARQATLNQFGLEIKGELPDFDEAAAKIARHIKVGSYTLRKFTRPKLLWHRPLAANLRANLEVTRVNFRNRRHQFGHWYRPKRMAYPFVGGHSDIFCVPASAFEDFAHYCGVFAAARIWVELAIPTALAMACEHLSTEASLLRRGIDVHFPPGSDLAKIKRANLLKEVEVKAHRSLTSLTANWPSEYLYMHPVKLSKWNW